VAESEELQKRRVELKKAQKALRSARRKDPYGLHRKLHEEVEYRLVRVYTQWEKE
jgi:hypothetical protein